MRASRSGPQGREGEDEKQESGAPQGSLLCCGGMGCHGQSHTGAATEVPNPNPHAARAPPLPSPAPPPPSKQGWLYLAAHAAVPAAVPAARPAPSPCHVLEHRLAACSRRAASESGRSDYSAPGVFFSDTRHSDTGERQGQGRRRLCADVMRRVGVPAMGSVELSASTPTMAKFAIERCMRLNALLAVSASPSPISQRPLGSRREPRT